MKKILTFTSFLFNIVLALAQTTNYYMETKIFNEHHRARRQQRRHREHRHRRERAPGAVGHPRGEVAETLPHHQA